MAEVPMKDFLLQYFRQTVFNSMSEEQFDQFKDWLAADTLTSGMKDWKKWNLVVKDDNGKWVKNEIMPGQLAMAAVPATATTPATPATPASDVTMSPKEWEKLFKAFLNAFQEMDANKSKFKDNKDANEFMNKYFGTDGQIFGHAKATPVGSSQIAVLEGILSNNTLRQKVDRALRAGGYWNVLGDDETIDDFLKEITDKKYDKNPKIQDKIKKALEVLEQYTEADPATGGYTYPFATYGIDLSDKDNWFKFDITDEKKTRFRIQYGNLLSTIANKSKVYDVFKDYGSKITDNLDKARSDVNFKDGDNQVPPKRKDDYNYWDKFTKKVKDAITPYTDKWTKIRGGHVYNIPQAKIIVDAAAKANMHPQDGLKKFVENADKIKSEAIKKDPNIGKTVDWTIKTLKEIQSTMPKAFEGALKSGHLMRHVADAIMLKAAQENKVAEAKATLEALSVLRYGYLTSNTMTAFRKDKLELFSDKSLSWNKHEGMAFVSRSLDYTLKASFIITGYTITAARHWISNRRLKNSKSQYQKEVKKLNGQSNTARQNIQADIQEYTALRDATSARLEHEWRTATRANGTHFRSETTYTTYLGTEADKFQRIWERHTRSGNALQQRLANWLSANPRTPANASDFDTASTFMRALQSGLPLPDPATVTPAITRVRLQNLLNDIYSKQSDINTANKDYTEAKTKRDSFKAGKEDVKKYDDNITKLKSGLSNLDTDQITRLEELHKFWNFLQAGSATRTGNWLYEKLGNTNEQNANNQTKKTYNINGVDKEMTKAEYQLWLYQQQHDLQAA